MKNDFDLIIKKTYISKDVTIYPISDVHLGSLEHNRNEWIGFVKELEKDDNAYIILGGDLINNSTRSSVGNIFDETMRPREQKRLMVECLRPIKDKIIACVSGNHERRSIKDADDDPTYDIMAKLDLEDIYRPNIAFVKFQIGQRSQSNKAINTYTICVTHGAGGGIYTGAAVNRNERFGNIIEGLDCLIVGHTHKGTISKPQKIVIDSYNNLVTMKPFTVVSMASWMSYGGYAAQKMLLPSDHARAEQPQKIILSSEYNKKKITTIW
uniref:Metallophosphatase domain protein n=1 Tax=Siphoviridae sp. ctMgg26 TaxID=2825462 RepID=A0A8S5Q0I6_9CAUD|nr:MAG TPA: metallophosphatase domain protein [Siphoviridae sp. ctMgg26]